jgi:ankyrin repeat protein
LFLNIGCGIGSEVQREYTGVDLLIQNKTENIFHELQYPFKISLYRPIDRTLAKCIPLPDEARILARQNTILHEIATQGLSNNFNELIRISKDGNHELRDKAKFILNKINGRNQQGQTPLILAIQAKKYEFVELLLDNNVDINMTDAQGCSPLQHACRQANHKLLKKLINRKADPHYCNRKYTFLISRSFQCFSSNVFCRETTDDTHQSNLSAFHYLALVKFNTSLNNDRSLFCLKILEWPKVQQQKISRNVLDIFWNVNVLSCL